MTPTMLHTPELLQRVFELSTDDDNANNASVCRAWNAEATRIIWHDVSAGRLFSLLAPLMLEESDITDHYVFSRAIGEDDWDRFDRYAGKVRSLRFTATYSPAVLNEIALGRRRLDFLPNLVTVYNAPATPLLAYPGIKGLVFNSGMLSTNDAACWFTLVEHRMHDIELLHIEDQLYRTDLGIMACTSALQRTTFLKTLVVPAGYLTDSTIPILASMPHLQNLRAEWRFQGQIKGSFTAHALSALPTTPFPSLQEFGAYVCFHTLTAYMAAIESFGRLRVLKISSDTDEALESYSSLFSAIALHAPLLEVLELSTVPWTQSAITPDPCDTVESNRRLGDMLRSLTCLRSLSLHCFGADNSSPLCHLPLFARNSTTLQSLHLDFDWTLTPESESELVIAPCTFPALRELHFGQESDPLEEPTDVANFLSRILPPECAVYTHTTLGDLDSSRFWSVEEWLPVLIKARMEERRAALVRARLP
ncbi:hypothetical protein AB1N83_014401 [Pleurotus pulmonarius]|nr:hypothetical protein EYR36_009995 [Pleurotus pulmonarius]KAF4593471.1 hypothetical protein EYR38_009186 [Pleurotus pulmonarius]